MLCYRQTGGKVESMKKVEQEQINEICKTEFGKCMHEITAQGGLSKFKRLRSCSARVGETDSYYILQSYNTLVAIIDKNTDTLYDVLRYVYGYTSTSAQHIAKFRHDYGQGKWGCENEYRYYSV